MAARRKRRRKPALTRPQRIAALVCTLLLLCAAAVIAVSRYGEELRAVFEPSFPSAVTGGELQVHVIDVGNADSILVTKDGQSLLIDAGENKNADTVIAYLRAQKVDRLDYVIATHADADHIGGMDDVVNTFPIGTFIMATMPEEATPTTKTYLKLLQALDAQGLSITEAEPGQTHSLGSALLTILGPAGTFTDTNEMSVVCRVDFGSTGFLFMGDAEQEAEAALLASGQNLRADFLKAGHHGSSSSSSEALIAAARPRYAALTCGAGNSYGHPHAETLETLEKYNVTCYRSDLNGTIRAVSDGSAVTVTTEK